MSDEDLWQTLAKRDGAGLREAAVVAIRVKVISWKSKSRLHPKGLSTPYCGGTM
jgi:hypothetical protein